MNDSAAIFPGQGSQSVGMGRDVAEACAAARRVFDRANEVVGYDLACVCFGGPAEELERTDRQQPAIFVTSVALWTAFVEAGGRREQFSRMGGLSLGEYTALHLAGALTFDDALKLVQRRGELMQQASTAAPSGMASLVGADEAAAHALCDRARGDDVLGPANFNCPRQIVISGHKTACERAVALAGEFGCRAVSLPVAGAFHSLLMEPAADDLWTTLEQTPFAVPCVPVIANVDGEYHKDPDSLRDALKRQLTRPVLWQRCIERMIEDGMSRFVEIGPGRVLTGLMRKINREVSAINVSKAELLKDAVVQPNAG
ncbi:MAG: ACP S-malonyltransferase [Phycisphaerales bacterium]|nr:MAG: ACP S-malonyltransferase [Phycisphaerales bacterium]